MDYLFKKVALVDITLDYNTGSVCSRWPAGCRIFKNILVADQLVCALCFRIMRIMRMDGEGKPNFVKYNHL